MKSLVPVGPLEMPLVSLRQQTAKKISKVLSKMLLSLFMHPVTKQRLTLEDSSMRTSLDRSSSNKPSQKAAALHQH